MCVCVCVCVCVVNGSTGESLSLTVVERKLIAEEWMKVAGDRLAVCLSRGPTVLS